MGAYVCKTPAETEAAPAEIMLDRAYEAARFIHFEGMQYRRDIGAKALTTRF